MKFDYERDFQIDIVNEIANDVYARLLNFILNSGIDAKDKANPYVIVLDQLADMLHVNMFTMTVQEVKVLQDYWASMHKFIDGLHRDVNPKEQHKAALFYGCSFSFSSMISNKSLISQLSALHNAPNVSR